MGWRAASLLVLGLGVAFGAYYVLQGRPTPAPEGLTNLLMPTQESSGSFALSIPAFMDGGPIPAAYTCDGRNESPEVAWSGVPTGTRSLVLIMEDPDVPKELGGGPFVHWILYNIPPSAPGIAKGWPAGSPGKNSAGDAGYTGPCPPIQYEPREHRYIFTLYALDTEGAQFAVLPEKSAIMSMMSGHIIAQAQYTGRYARP